MPSSGAEPELGPVHSLSLPTSLTESGPPSHEEWLAERARYAVAMLRDCTEVNPKKCGGVPVLKGTRFSLAQVLAEIAEGRSVSELAEDFELEPAMIKEFLEGMAIALDRPFPT
jgi:uncharacterized protein (DUF433 family)